MDGIGSVVDDKEQRCSTGCVRPIPYVRGMVRNVPGTFRMPESCGSSRGSFRGMFQERSARLSPVEPPEEAFEECSGMFRKAPHASGMFQERSACLTPVPGQHTDLRRDPAAHVRSAPPPPPPIIAPWALAGTPSPYHRHDTGLRLCVACPVLVDEDRNGTRKEPEWVQWGGCAAEGSFEACRHKSLEQRKILSRS